MKFKLFISSTSEDLSAYREVAIRVGQRIGLDVVAMEDFGPDRSPPVDYCKQKVLSADIVLGLYAHRYGFQPDGYDGKSITQLEYEWAVDANKDFLAFIIDDNQPWLPKYIDDGDKKARLSEFKKLLSRRHVIDKFTAPEQLRSQLFEHLPESLARREEQEKAKERLTTNNSASSWPTSENSLPRPPQPYAAHTYTLLQTAQVVGRKKELALLDEWVSVPHAVHYGARLLVIVAIGGMGKSALTWKWFQDTAPTVMHPLTGRMWWSFYESDAGFNRFVTSTLAYCTGRSPKDIDDTLTAGEREAQLLRVLDEQPYLLVLDGAERLLIAYSGADFAHLADDELDKQTANHVAGALGLIKSEADVMTAQHRLRTCIDPHVGNFFKRLVRVRASRILVTSRLFPSELQTATGKALPGCEAVFLKGLQPEDAVTLWREMGVSGSDDELTRLFATFDYYPLLIRALAGEVARFRRAPGNFTVWQQTYRDFNPYSLPMVQVKNHVLEHALLNLDDRARDLLHTIAAFRSPAAYDTLLGLFQRKGKEWSVERLDAVLDDLEDRGLVGWNRQQNNYDLHPIVRGVVWSRLGADARQGVFDALHAHFEAIPATKSEKSYTSFEEASPDIELFNSLVGLQKFGDASKFYFDRIHPRENFSLLGYRHAKVAMLNSLFQTGYDYPPKDLDPAVYAQLAHCFNEESKFHDCFGLWLRAMQKRSHISEVHYCYLSGWCLELGLLTRFSNFIAMAEHVARSDSVFFGQMAKYYAVVLDLRAANACAKKYDLEMRNLYKTDMEKHDFNAVWAPIRFFEGDFEFAAKHGGGFLSSEAKLELGQMDVAIAELHDLLVQSRAKSWHLEELQARRVLAQAFRRKGNLAAARDVIEDFWGLAERGPYRLLIADVNNVLAEIERDGGNLSAAIKAAEEAYRQAWCDGPPHAYRPALDKARKLLDELGAPYPKPPSRDTSFDEILNRIPDPSTAINKSAST